MPRRTFFTLTAIAPLLAACAAEQAPPPSVVVAQAAAPHIGASPQAKLVDLARCHSRAQDSTAAGPETPAFNAQVDSCMLGLGYRHSEIAEQRLLTRRPRRSS